MSSIFDSFVSDWDCVMNCHRKSLSDISKMGSE